MRCGEKLAAWGVEKGRKSSCCTVKCIWQKACVCTTRVGGGHTCSGRLWQLTKQPHNGVRSRWACPKANVWVKASMRHCPLFHALNISKQTIEKMIMVIFVFKSSFKIYIIAIFCLHSILLIDGETGVWVAMMCSFCQLIAFIIYWEKKEALALTGLLSPMIASG